ncbi:MAG: hypothetical protein K2K03_10120 [Prevotella sp.]|nr:hypothetical protein [Prevotella sp.]
MHRRGLTVCRRARRMVPMRSVHGADVLGTRCGCGRHEVRTCSVHGAHTVGTLCGCAPHPVGMGIIVHNRTRN